MKGTTASTAFILAGYHARYNGGKRLIRKEVAGIDRVFDELALLGEEDVLMAGDFNLSSADLRPLTSHVDRTTGIASTLNRQGRPTAHLYDHLIVEALPGAELVPVDDAHVLDVRDYARCGESWRVADCRHDLHRGRFGARPGRPRRAKTRWSTGTTATPNFTSGISPIDRSEGVQ